VEQLTLVERGKLEWLDVPAAEVQGPGEALVRPLAVATCDLDALLVRGQAPFPMPIALGHECIGEVTEVGDEVTEFKAGDVVAVPFQISCGECEPCQEGRTGNCATVDFLSMYGFGSAGGDWGGALSELVRVPYADHMLVSIPAGLEPAAVASVSDNISDAWRTVAPFVDSKANVSVLIVGGGAPSIGLYAAGIAVALGAGQVDYLDRDADRLERAARLGANTIEGSYSERRGPYPITVDASGDKDGLAHALRATSPDGVCTSVGIYFEETPLPLLEMYTKGITFHTGRCHARSNMPRVLDLVDEGRLSPEIVTSRTVQWGDAAEALADHQGKHVVVRD
jgi:threonine dehydrogenase-like Zn-dependent dehydrogenase